MEVAKNEDRLVREVVPLLSDWLGWWAEFCKLNRKFGVEGEIEVVRSHVIRYFLRDVTRIGGGKEWEGNRV